MQTIDVLPDCDLRGDGAMTRLLRERGASTYHQACELVRAMPYGYNERSDDAALLFADGFGNCKSKHACIARLAQEHGLAVEKVLVFYRLDESLIDGILPIIRPFGLSWLPQMHCLLRCAGAYCDLTFGNCTGKKRVIDTWDRLVPVPPEVSDAEERRLYCEHLDWACDRYADLARVGKDGILAALELVNRRMAQACSLRV